MAKLWQFSEGHPKPAFSEKKQTGDQEKLLKNRPKSTTRFKGQRKLWRNVIILHFVSTYTPKTGEDFGAQGGSKSARRAKLWQFLPGHPKPAFSVKVQRGDQGNFFKNRPKSSPRLKGPKAHWCKWHYPLFCTQSKCKHWKTFWRKQWLQKCQNGQVIAIFARSFKTRIL